MKKITTIFFLSVYLLAATEAHQLLKLPVVFQHFNEHKQENQGISLLQFLTMHYFNDDPKDDDYERDMQLPFKTNGEHLSPISPAFVPFFVEAKIEKPVEFLKNETAFSQNQFLPSSYLDRIWHPPKSC